MSENRSPHSATATDEDKVIHRLCRTPIEDLDKEYRQRYWEFYKDRQLFDQWLDQHHWNKNDFFSAGKQRFG